MNNIKGRECRILRAAFALLLSIMMCMASVAPAMVAYAEDENTQGGDTAASFDVPDDTATSDDAQQEDDAQQTEDVQPDDAQQSDAVQPEDTQQAEDVQPDDTQQPDAVQPNDDTAANDAASEGDNDAQKNEDPQDNNAVTPQSEDKPAMLLANPAAPQKAPADDTVADGVAAIGDVKYASLQEAVDAAKDGDTVKLLADIELEKTVVVEGKSITISDDGNARIIKGKDNTVYALLKVAKGASLTLDGTSVENLKLQGGDIDYLSSNASVVYTLGELNIKKTTIDGGNLENAYIGGAVSAKGSEATVNISDGVIENTEMSTSRPLTAAVFIQDGAHLEMTGGIIQNNKSIYTGTNPGPPAGGGVCLCTWSSVDPLSTMNMSGGKITGNEAYYGGGVYMTGRSKFHMTGGSIDNNIAKRDGGGVCVSGVTGNTGYYKVNEFIMDGGSISGNRAANGAGIYVNSDAVYLNAGYIEHNVTTKISYNDYTGHGGGVYVSTVPRVLHISDAVITENIARPLGWFGGTSGMGGGLWACPTGSIDLNVSNGVAVYGNSTSGNDAAGDDVVNVYYSRQNPHGTITLPDRMLGGGRVQWYQDGAVKDDIVGYAITSVPRFDAENPGEPISFDALSESIAVKAVTTDAAIKRANDEAKLFIRYNIANHGGGIATNGDLALKSYDYKDWKLLVEKKWEDIDEAEQKEVNVFLKIDEEILDGVTLNSENEWKGEFTQLPDQDTIIGKDISVVEGKMVADEEGVISFVEEEEYAIDYDKVVDEEEQTIYITVTNRKKPPVRITKKALGGDELEGAKIEIRDSNGELVDSWTSTKEAHEIVLKKGDYTLKETVAPEGYYAVETEIRFSVDKNGNVATESVEVVDENGGRVKFEGNDIVIEDAPVVEETFEDVPEEPEIVKGVSEDEEVAEVEAEKEKEAKVKVKGVSTGDNSMLYAWVVASILTACILAAAIVKRRRANNS